MPPRPGQCCSSHLNSISNSNYNNNSNFSSFGNYSRNIKPRLHQHSTYRNISSPSISSFNPDRSSRFHTKRINLNKISSSSSSSHLIQTSSSLIKCRNSIRCPCR